MKSLLKNMKSWMTGKQQAPTAVAAVETPVEAPVTTPVEVAAPVLAFRPAAELNSKPAPTQVQVAVAPAPRVRREPVIEPERKPMEISSLYNGPEVKLVSRGAKVYGVCPHCEAMWNVRERLTHPSFRRQENGKGLTCPACDKSVGLPANTDLRKLS